MRHRILTAAAVLAALALASQASANTVSVTYQGIVDATQTTHGIVLPAPDFDVAGLFGGGNLEGMSFTAVINYDTSLGLSSSSGGVTELSGGAAFSDPSSGLVVASPILDASFTINGYTYSYAPDYYANLQTEPGSNGYIQQTATDEAGDNAILSYSTTAAPGSLDYSFSSTSGMGAGYLLTAFGPSNVSDNLQLALLGVQVSAAPEPSSWALMLLGLGGIGMALRRSARGLRSRRQAVLAA